MKTIKNKKREFLFNNEYWERMYKISKRDYELLYDEREKERFTERDDLGNYIEPENCPEISDSEFMQMVSIETHEKINTMLNGINTIKGCMIFFVVLQALSIIGGIILMSQIGSLF